jgi:hypothetical protein
MFPLRNGRVTPYHKSVLDWLLSQDAEGNAVVPAHTFAVKAEAGHALLARACCKLLLGTPLPLPPPPATEEEEELGRPRVGEAYALRHAAAHACRRDGSPELLQGLLLNFGAWHAIVKAGEWAG